MHCVSSVFLLLSTAAAAAAMSTNMKSATPSPAKPLIIFCHGSGDTGYGVQTWIESLLPATIYEQYDWLYPTAKPIPYTLNGGHIDRKSVV